MQTDLSQINDLKELKAMAYDQIAAKELAQNNLHAVNTRIAELQGVAEQFKAAVNGEDITKSSISDDDLGIEDGDKKPDGVE